MRIVVTGATGNVGTSVLLRGRGRGDPPGVADPALPRRVHDTATNVEGSSRVFAAAGTAGALLELIEGLRQGAGFGTPPLARRAGGALRLREIATGLGARIGL